jgi:hypothetical protein
MSLNNEDKSIIVNISVLFVIIIFVSFVISHFGLKDDVNYSQSFFDGSSFDEDEFQKYLEEINYLNPEKDDGPLEEIEDKDLSYEDTNLKQLNIFEYDKCTPLMEFKDFVKINKRYKFELNDLIFFVNERHVSSINNLHVVDLRQSVTYEGNSFNINGEFYYDNSGNCLKVFYDFSDVGKEVSEMDCSGNPFSFVCEEMLENLNYSGIETYFVYGKKYDVMVYSNEDESIILKYGKNLPVLFYLQDYTNKRMKIELLGLEERG